MAPPARQTKSPGCAVTTRPAFEVSDIISSRQMDPIRMAVARDFRAMGGADERKPKDLTGVTCHPGLSCFVIYGAGSPMSYRSEGVIYNHPAILTCLRPRAPLCPLRSATTVQPNGASKGTRTGAVRFGQATDRAACRS